MGDETHRTQMEITLQGQSRGIFYEGYDKQFIQCIFEDGEIQGRNERYEFRCDASLECCGRVCCTPQDSVIPLWLMIIFIILALLLLLALLGTIAYLCAKRRKQKPKKLNTAAYSSLSKQNVNGNGDRQLLVRESENYSTPDYYRTTANDYRQNGYGLGIDRDAEAARRAAAAREYGRGAYGGYGNGYGGPGYGRRGSDGSGGSMRRGVTETFESEYKEEIVYEKTATRFVPSPMTEELLSAPRPVKIVQHSADEISRSLDPQEAAVVLPDSQRAQIAFHRPFIPDPMEETEFAAPLRHSASYHSVNEISQSQSIQYSTVEPPVGKNAQVMFTRPGFDNVPSY